MTDSTKALAKRLREAADERSSTTPPYWTAVPRDLLREAAISIEALGLAENIERNLRRQVEHERNNYLNLWEIEKQRANRLERQNMTFRDQRDDALARAEAAEARLAEAEAHIKAVVDAVNYYQEFGVGLYDERKWVKVLDPASAARAFLTRTQPASPCGVCGGRGQRIVSNDSGTTMVLSSCSACRGMGTQPASEEPKLHRDPDCEADVYADDCDCTQPASPGTDGVRASSHLSPSSPASPVLPDKEERG